MDPRVFPHLWLRLTFRGAVLTPSILLRHPCIFTLLRGLESCVSAFFIWVQSDPPHISATAYLHKTQHSQGNPCGSITEPHPSLAAFFLAWVATIFWSAAYRICPHTRSVLKSSMLISSSQDLLSCQAPLGASQYAAIYGLCQQCGEIQGLFT